jgi:hypothetical protein
MRPHGKSLAKCPSIRDRDNLIKPGFCDEFESVPYPIGRVLVQFGGELLKSDRNILRQHTLVGRIL